MIVNSYECTECKKNPAREPFDMYGRCADCINTICDVCFEYVPESLLVEHDTLGMVCHKHRVVNGKAEPSRIVE